MFQPRSGDTGCDTGPVACISLVLVYVGPLPRAVRLTYNSPHSSPQGGTIVARLVRARSAPKLIRVPSGTAAFRYSLVSPRWASLPPQPRSRVFCCNDYFGLACDKA